MRKKKAALITLMLIGWGLTTGTILAQNPDPYIPDSSSPKIIPGMTLIWNDEFNRNGKPDPASWGYETGFVRNEELQWYSPDNAYCTNGVLVLEGRKEKFKNPNYTEGSKDWKLNREYADYTSASINTRGLRQWQFGRFEIRAKINITQGEWIDIWTMGVNQSWPGSGEIDIAEFHGAEIRANVIWAGKMFNGTAMHSVNKLVSDLISADPDWSRKFHTWRMDWDSTAIKLFLDDTLLQTTMLDRTINPDGTNGFLQPHYILLSNALGVYGGDPSKSEFPIRFEIDYVRVYQPSGDKNALSQQPPSLSVPRDREIVTATPPAASGTTSAPAPATVLITTIPADANSSLSGKWRVHVNIAGNESDADCTFIQQVSDLSGSCTDTLRPVTILGKVNGNAITWSLESEYNGSPLTTKYNGMLDSTKIIGTASVEQFGVSGDFTATREKTTPGMK
jgi:beta-glucanase (GH16 family)